MKNCSRGNLYLPLCSLPVSPLSTNLCLLRPPVSVYDTSLLNKPLLECLPKSREANHYRATQIHHMLLQQPSSPGKGNNIICNNQYVQLLGWARSQQPAVIKPCLEANSSSGKYKEREQLNTGTKCCQERAASIQDRGTSESALDVKASSNKHVFQFQGWRHYRVVWSFLEVREHRGLMAW
jgi:hypothetical protein